MNQLDACGMPLLPVGDCVSLVRAYRVPLVLAAGEVNYDITQVMEKNFLWRGIACDPTAARNVNLRFQTAKNYYLAGGRARLSNLCGAGFNTRAWEPEMFVPKGEEISIEASNDTGSAIATFVILWGVDLEEV